jgi:hypothetical protein
MNLLSFLLISKLGANHLISTALKSLLYYLGYFSRYSERSRPSLELHDYFSYNKTLRETRHER